jgi:hypothetical protein
MTPSYCSSCGQPLDKCNCDDLRDGGYYNDEEIEDMKKRHPGHSEEAYRTGRNLGVDFPYVPGDPFW